MNTTVFPSVENIAIDLSVQLGATLVGALIGFGLALRYDRKKKKEDKQEAIKHIVESITEELQDITKITTEETVKFSELMQWNPTKRVLEGKTFSISTPAYDSALNSGNFLLLPTELQTRLSAVYNRIYECERSMTALKNFYSTSAYTTSNAGDIAINLHTNLLTHIDELKTEYAGFLPFFKSNKNKFTMISSN